MPKLQLAENRRHGSAGRGQTPEEQRMNISNETNSLAQAGDFFFTAKRLDRKAKLDPAKITWILPPNK